NLRCRRWRPAHTGRPPRFAASSPRAHAEPALGYHAPMRIPAMLRPLPDSPLRLEGVTRDALYRAMRSRLLIALTLMYAFFYTARGVLDVVKKPLIDAGIYDAGQLGTLGTCLLGAYAVGKLVNGMIADRVRVSRFLA